MIGNYAPGGNRDSEVSPPVRSYSIVAKLMRRTAVPLTFALALPVALALALPDGARPATPLADAGLSPHATVLWIGAHPDDEALVAGALLAELSRSGRRVFVVSLTRGEGTGIPGHEADEETAAVRAREYCLACTLYQAQDCASEGFPSLAHLSGQAGAFRESPAQVIETWRRRGHADPVRCLAEWIEQLSPEWILTLDPDHGMYGHPEHRAAGMLAVAAARTIAPAARPRVFAAENRFASILSSNLDPGPVTLAIAADVPCSLERTCWEIGAEAAATYASQGLPDLRGVPPAERVTSLRELPVR